MGALSEVTRPFQWLYLDFLGPYPRTKRGNAFILIVLDKYSRFVFLKALRNANAANLVEFVEGQIFNLFSVPETVLTDNGKQFASGQFKALLNKYGVKHLTTPKYTPQPNSSERVNRCILSAIRAYLKTDQRDWDIHLQEIGSALRNVQHSSSGYSPHYLVFGDHKINHGNDYQLRRLLLRYNDNELCIISKPARLNLARETVLKHLRQAYATNSKQYNLRSRVRSWNPGQKVFIKNFVQSDATRNFNSKLAPLTIPALLSKPIGQVSYECTDLDGHPLGVYHMKDIYCEAK